MKKTLLVLALIVFSIPVITFAKDVPPGQPFEQLQSQINMINSQLVNLMNQFQNIDNTSAGLLREINGIKTQLENLTEQSQNIGITHIIHGRSDENGQKLAGENWKPLYNGEADCSFYEYEISLDSMTDPQAPPPHCTVAPSWTILSGTPCPGPRYDFYPIGIRVATSWGRWGASNWTLTVQMRWYIEYPIAFPYQTQFDFICVQ
jgi:hypothetical protein